MDRKPHRKRNMVLFVCLALICIGGVELLACRHFAPDLYASITAPVRSASARVSQVCTDAAASVAQSARDTAQRAKVLWEDWTTRPEPPPPEEEEPVSQLAGAPALEAPLSLSPPSITELVEADGIQYLTGGVTRVTYFNQTDPIWAEEPYGSDQIGGYGCGPTAMAMAVSSLSEFYIPPTDMARLAVEQGYWARRSGSYLSIVEGLAQQFGLYAQSLTPTTDAIRERLLSGQLVVALMGPGHFTKGGHFILIRGITLSGDVLVADPASTERSLAVWDPQLILDELSANHASGGPLWVVSAVPLE